MSMEFKAPLGWHIAYGVSTIMLLAASVIIVLRDYDPPWMKYQSEFNHIYAAKLESQYAKAAAADPKSDKTADLYEKMVQVEHSSMEVKQLYLGSTQWLSDYKALVERVDRCSTCHMAVDYAVQASFESAQTNFGQEALPFTAHPNPGLMDKHDPEKMGCALCHGGQGRAIKSVVEAHGEVRFWEEPLVDDWTVYNDMKSRGTPDPLTPPEHIQASCAKCHIGNTTPLDQAPLLSQARQMFAGPVIKGNPNCTTCHRIGDKGGTLAPELTEEGNKWRDAEGWIRAHFRAIYPEAMKKLGVKDVADVWTASPQERKVYFTRWVYEHFLNPPLFQPGYYITQDDATNSRDNPNIYVFSPDSSYLREYTADDHFIQEYAVPDSEKPKDWTIQNITLHGVTLASSVDPDTMSAHPRPVDLKLRVSSPRTIMPAFPFNDDEAKAMTLFVLSQTGELLPPQYIVQPKVETAAVSASAAPVKLAGGDAAAGQAVFNAKGCVACHNLTAEKKIGPGLKGVTGRRTKEWMANWIRNPQAAIDADPKLKTWTTPFGQVMPTLGLQDKEIADVVAFLDTQK